jgi:DNA repair exonuclease SbcCD nuclease subunit
MSKFIILGDIHIGARSASTIVMEHQLHYFESVFFPYMKENNIKTILQLGDMFDTRKFSNHLILHNWRKRFFNYMLKENITFITLLGNHDIVFKNTVDVNSTTIFLSHYPNIQIVDTPITQDIEGVPFLIMPWIYPGERQKIDDAIANTNALYCAGHFEFSGFESHPGHVMTEGITPDEFSKFDIVFSGHYHTRSRKGNIEYIGIPYELTWIDYSDPKGFTVFDTKTHKHSFVRNTQSLFAKLIYNDKNQSPDYWKTIDTAPVKNSYVKIIVGSKTDPYQFDKFVEKVASLGPIELKIMDEIEDFDDICLEEEDIKVEDTSSLIEQFVDQVDTSLNKHKIAVMLKNLYVEALNQ